MSDLCAFLIEVLEEFKPHDYREHRMGDDETAVVLGDVGEIVDRLLAAIAGSGRGVFEPVDESLEDW